jgi:Glycosyltransferase family 87
VRATALPRRLTGLGLRPRRLTGLGLRPRRRWVYLALVCWGAVWFVILAHRGGIDWKFFTTGTSLLFGGHPTVITGITGGPSTAGPAGLPGPPPPGGLHIFANYPALQMGPLAYLVTGVLRQFGPHNGLVAAELFLQACGLLIVYLVQRTALRTRPELDEDSRFDLALLAGGAVFLVAWSELSAGFAHLDDGLALLLAVLAACTAVSQPVMAGVCAGLAADAKPWALVFVPVLLISRSRRDVTIAAAAALAVLAVAWLPFLIADPHSLTAAKFLIRNENNSALRALGVTENYTPSWDRPAQILLGCALGSAAVWRGRWPAVLLLAGGARLLLDPAAHSYYTPDVMTGALLWDLLGSRRPVPLCTITSFAALNVAPLIVADQKAQGAIRLALILALTVTTLVLPASETRNPQATGSPPRQTRLGCSP